MEIRVNNIVRIKGTNEVFEVVNIKGEILICRPVNTSSNSLVAAFGLPLKRSEVEVMMEEETDAFNILFRKDPNETT